MKVRYQADADLDEDIVTGLRRREPTLDFQTAMEGGLESLNDRGVLARAGLESVLALHELAMHWEHGERDFRSAIELCEEALERLGSGVELPLGFRERWREAFEHRLRRLRRRLSG